MIALSSTFPETVKSVYQDQDDILRAIKRLHCPDGFDCDATYGNGSFWKNLERPKLCFDITPLHDDVIQADSRLLPLGKDSINSLVFDPPFLTYIKSGREHNSIMAKRYGGYYTYEELEEHYRDSISEAYRVLRAGGVMVFKCQDIIHNHKMHCTHFNVISMAAIEGFRLLDLFILTKKNRLPVGRGKQQHARIHHSYFLVFKK